MSRGLDTFTGEFVYRTLRPDEDPTKDIACMNSGSRRGVDEHVEDGLTYSSRFISTSASFSKAEKWIHTARRHSPARYSERGVRNTIVKISVKILKDEYPNTANSAYNFTDRLVRAKFLPESDQRGFARGYEEVVFISSIPKEAITDVYVVGRGWIGTSPPIEQITNTPSPVPSNSTGAATAANSSVNSTLSASTNSPIKSLPSVPLQPITIQSLVTIPPDSTVSSISGSTDDSLTTSVVIQSADLVGPKTGVKRKTSSEEPEPPLKQRRKEEQVIPNISIYILI